MTVTRRSVWTRTYAVATWGLVGIFALMAVAHLVLTVLFYVGVWDTGFGYVLDYEWPAWSITIIDTAAAFLFWFGYRRGADSPWLGLFLTILASCMALARAMWMVFVPIFVLVVIAASIGRIAASHRAAEDHA